ncbi:DUF6923 family protein [Streptomyces olivoreticuli]
MHPDGIPPRPKRGTDMARKYVYLAVGRQQTRLYRFDPVDWDIALVDKVPAYKGYYAAMGERDGKLYAMSGQDLVTVNPEGGAPSAQHVAGLRVTGTWFCGDVKPDGSTLIVCAGPADPAYEINLGSKAATALNPAGAGRWDDWSYHPNDGRLYAVEGDNGDLLHMDFSRSPAKVVLKRAVFPPAEQSSSGGRKSYSAVFFDESGNFYAIDSKGNANVLDLTASTKSKPATKESIGTSRRLSDTPLPVGDLEVLNAAGMVDKIPVVAPPVITEPRDKAPGTPRQVIRGTVAEGVDKVELFEDASGSRIPLGSAVLQGSSWTYTPTKNWSVGNHTILAVAHKGKRDSLPATVRFSLAALAPPVITAPLDGATVDLRQVIRGTVVEGVDAVTLSEGGSELDTPRLSGTAWTYTPIEDWAERAHTVQAVARRGSEASAPATVRFTAADPNLKVDQKFGSHWKKVWDKDPQIYSFTLTVRAKRTRITTWTVMFQVPPNTTVDPDWARTFAFEVVDRGDKGTVKLRNSDSKKTIDPGSPLPLGIQVLFPGEDKTHEFLENLSGREGTGGK